MGGRDAPAVPFFERDESRLPRQHFDGDPQNAGQQFLTVKFLREGTGYFEEVITLANTEIWEHGRILSPACWQNIRDFSAMEREADMDKPVFVDKSTWQYYNPFKNAKSQAFDLPMLLSCVNFTKDSLK